MQKHPLCLALSLILLAIAARADTPATQPAEAPWGLHTQELQSRLTITNSPTKDSPIQVKVELRNNADAPLDLTHLRVWLMVAQGPERVFYTSPWAGPEKKNLAPGESITFTFDAAVLDAFPYLSRLVIKNGLPAVPPGDVQPLPAAVGKLTDFLPAGRAKAKAFIAVTRAGMLAKSPETFVVPSNACTVDVRERSLATLDPTARRATLDELTALFKGSALSGKTGHDRAIAIGKDAVPHLLESLNDPHLSDPGRMWLTATLVELGDKRAVAPLIALLNKGGNAAYVVAYIGPKMKDPTLNAAIQRAAKSLQDPALADWARRGLQDTADTTNPSPLKK